MLGDALDMAAQLDLLGEQRLRARRYSALSLGWRVVLVPASSAAGFRAELVMTEPRG